MQEGQGQHRSQCAIAIKCTGERGLTHCATEIKCAGEKGLTKCVKFSKTGVLGIWCLLN